MRAIRVDKPGGPEALALADVPLPEPGPGEVRVRLEAIGVNFIDVYHRTGLYPLAAPFIPGSEGAGAIDAIGAGVAGLARGDRVAFAMARGAYAEQVVVPAALIVRVPEALDARTAAAALLQGMTAHYLTRATFPLAPGHWALVHAAAGGAGRLIVQLARRQGARVIGTVSTAAKAAVARAAGADAVVNYSEADFAAEARRLTGGRGVDVVYDSVGRATFEHSLDSLRPRGMLALFGQSSGPVPPVDPQRLARGSLFLTRPGLGDHIRERAELEQRAGDVLAWVAARELEIRIERTLPLADAAQAHRLLESRATAGKLLLVP